MQERPHLKSFRDWIRQIFFGMCIGGSDLVPGISGGTMALILGIYEEFIFAVRSLGSRGMLSLFSFDIKRFTRDVCWDFLLGLLIGAGIAFLIFSQAIHLMLADPNYRMLLYAVFIGMVVGSSCIYLRRFKNWKSQYWIPLAFGMVVTYFLTGTSREAVHQNNGFDVQLPSHITTTIGEKDIRNYSPQKNMLLDVSSVTLGAMLQKGTISPDTPVIKRSVGKMGKAGDFVKPAALSRVSPWLILCGAMAVTAMLLPGVSGSYLLNMVGVYPVVIGALVDFIRHADVDAFFILLNLGVGIVIGAPIVSKIIGWLLKHYHDAALAMLLGCMIGALQTMWPFYTYEYTLLPLQLDKGAQLNLLQPYLPSLQSVMTYTVCGFMFIGFLAVMILERTAIKGSASR